MPDIIAEPGPGGHLFRPPRETEVTGEVKDLPYFRWFPADAEGDEKYASFSDAELGFYHRCLNRSWINDGLPGDLKAIAKLLGRTTPYVEKIWATVGRCFYLDGDGRYRNPRQEEERTKARTKSGRCSDAVRTRYERSTDVGTDVGTDVLPRALARPDSESDSDSSESRENNGKPKERLPPRNPSLTTQVTDPQWFEFMAKWQETGGTEASVGDWDKALMCWRGKDLPERLEASAGLARDHVGKENCLPQNYLANRIYRRGIRKTTSSQDLSRSERATINATRKFLEKYR